MPNQREDLSDDFQEDLVRSARRSFPGFYRGATANDAPLLASLVLVNAALTVGMSAPRNPLPAAVRYGLEQSADEMERIFTALREAVRTSSAFAGIPSHEQYE